MPETVYILHDCDDWVERHNIVGVYRSRERAVTAIQDCYSNYTYDIKHDQWYNDDNGYLWIQETTLY